MLPVGVSNSQEMYSGDCNPAKDIASENGQLGIAVRIKSLEFLRESFLGGLLGPI